LIIDGHDLDAQHVGFYPDEILGREMPLLPTVRPRRVAVYRCTCGVPGCSSLAPLIAREDNRIRWTDFRTYVGTFDGPISEDDDLSDGRRSEVEPLTFDATQYLDEVRRASDDHSWETPDRRAARLVREFLEDSPNLISVHGLTLDGAYASPRRGGEISVSFWDNDHHYVQRPYSQLSMTFPATSGDPEDRAEVIIERLKSLDIGAWAVSYDRFHGT
jgi:hypothetical protein